MALRLDFTDQDYFRDPAASIERRTKDQHFAGVKYK
jgi:hypothetical protein